MQQQQLQHNRLFHITKDQTLLTTFSSSSFNFYDIRFAVTDCFNEGCNALDCAGPVINTCLILVVMGLSIIQLVRMTHKGIQCTWKLFLTCFVFFQTFLMFFEIIFIHYFFWTFILAFLELSGFLLVLFFFAQYSGRVTFHSDKLPRYVCPIFSVFITCMLIILIVEILIAAQAIDKIDLCFDVGLVFIAFLRCVVSAILIHFVSQISRRMRAQTNSGTMKNSLIIFSVMAIIYFFAAVFYLLMQVSLGFSFDNEQECIAYLYSHHVLLFFVVTGGFFLGSALPYSILLYYVHSITSPISSTRKNIPKGPRPTETTPALNGAQLIDPIITQMLMNAHQRLLSSTGDPAPKEGSPDYDCPSTSSSTTSSQSSYSFLQAVEFTSGPSAKPNVSDGELSDDSESRGFFDPDPESEPFFTSPSCGQQYPI